MHYIVYKTTNQVNGKFYIGTHKTVDLNDDYLGSGTLLKRAIKKYGVENFKKEILFAFDNPEDMFAKEAEIVTEEFLSENNTYNLKKGGFGGFDYVNGNKLNLYFDHAGSCLNGKNCKNNFKHGDELKNVLLNKGSWDSYREKISANKKRYFSENPANFLGKKHTEETKRKIGNNSAIHQKGSKNSQYGKVWCVPENSLDCSIRKPFKKDCIPKGWITTKELKQKNKQKNKLNEIKINNKLKQDKQNHLRELHKLYCSLGFDKFVETTGYKYSQSNLVQQFSRWLPEFVSQNGKRR